MKESGTQLVPTAGLLLGRGAGQAMWHLFLGARNFFVHLETSATQLGPGRWYKTYHLRVLLVWAGAPGFFEGDLG